MAGSPSEIESLVRTLVTSLVDAPEKLEVSSSDEDGAFVIELSLDPDDVGKVIGRQGRIIKAIRTVARAAGSQSGLQVEVEVLG